ncbi:hypothetical protein CN639_04215 [Bacillus toyonensis]|uniref:Uncharacterized protein n=1 Tax=Bacillus toyonensis TaxID=155322 RepID=A0AB36SUZ2_9BACI|nr:hypothetical protein [Bacillus toyonensis]PKR94359.1 hypothetical protein bcere0024_021280 [Bacillus cereus Rock4-18]PEC10519.1 hypothetical protein CON55_12400 [Bacillus toyonensis]PEJ61880.1 hypothetical protein CN906_23060 [Bacillus toyonensis]PEM93882.1 hypothetical protein CN639_04215 [Bacillus toyonensis]PEN71529.1 hypothetical protein CN545_08790 [Bacillus toyonensis]
MGKYVKDQKVVSYTLLGLAPCTVVRVGWFFIMVEEVETKHLYSITKKKLTPIEEEAHYLVEESIDEDGVFDIGRLFAKIKAEDMDLAKKSFEENKDFKKYEDFHNPSEGKLYGGEYYTTIKTGKELLKQYFNREELERNRTN